ncbi:hypothetical protein [Streptomyces anthocyanicus]|uniref:hypothetical protein n=1 Tax=Streptomyces anthocyanicus TaxID=68174 RepID=UPI00365A7FBA
MTQSYASTGEWLDTITTDAHRSLGRRVFSASVPLSGPYSPYRAGEQLLSSVIEGVEAMGWQLESTTSYGGPDRDYPFPPYDTVVQF